MCWPRIGPISVMKSIRDSNSKPKLRTLPNWNQQSLVSVTDDPIFRCHPMCNFSESVWLSGFRDLPAVFWDLLAVYWDRSAVFWSEWCCFINYCSLFGRRRRRNCARLQWKQRRQPLSRKRPTLSLTTWSRRSLVGVIDTHDTSQYFVHDTICRSILCYWYVMYR